MKKLAGLAVALLLAACQHGGGGGNTPPPPLPSSGWTFYYSTGVAGTCDDFEYPRQNGVHYCVKAQTVQAGQYINMVFTITGAGTVLPVEGNDIPPATLRLFLWRRGDDGSAQGVFQKYRYWSKPINIQPGDNTISVKIAPENFTDVFGISGADSPLFFQAVLDDLQGVGWTQGGQYFAGHGTYSSGGNHFKLQVWNTAASSVKRKKQ